MNLSRVVNIGLKILIFTTPSVATYLIMVVKKFDTITAAPSSKIHAVLDCNVALNEALIVMITRSVLRLPNF